MNLAEVVGHYVTRGASSYFAISLVEMLDIEVVDVNVRHAASIGGMIEITKQFGLSLGDRACLTVARDLGVPVYTADRPWLQVADALRIDVRLIR